MLKYAETPIQQLLISEAEDKGIEILVKREDLNHPHISGNKWWKLKHHLINAKERGYSQLLTFGGAYSNHIYATAAAAEELGWKSIGIIRGENHATLNSTLSFVTSKGMILEYVSREDYKRKITTSFLESLQKNYPGAYFIPEGGTSDLSFYGCREWGEKLCREIDFDYLCLPVGTGGTMAGVIGGIGEEKKVLGFSSLKNGAFLSNEINKWLSVFSITRSNWSIQEDYHFGGYAKSTAPLKIFINSMQQEQQLPLDHVYTGKMIFGVRDLIQKNYFQSGTKILILHTGGLQGNSFPPYSA